MRLTIHNAFMLRRAWFSRCHVSSLMIKVNYNTKFHQNSGYLLSPNFHQGRWLHFSQIKQDSFSNNGLSDKKLSSLPSTKTSLLKLLDLAKSESAYIAGAIGLLVITSSVTLAVPYCMGKIIDIIQSVSKDGSPQSTLQPIVTGLCALFVLGALANAGRIYLLQTSGERITKQLRQSVFSSIVAQDVSFFDKSETGELINRLASDVPMVSASVTQNISDGLRSLAQITTGVGMMYLMSPDLAHVILMVVPPVTVLAGFYGKYIQKVTQKTQNSLAKSTQFADERLSNIRTVQSFGKENLEANVYSAHVNSVLNLGIKEAIARAFFFGLTGFSGNMIMLLVLYNGGQMMHTGKISVGDLSAFLLYSAYVSFSIRGLSNFFTAMNKSIGASTRLWELIDRSPEISLNDGTIPDSTVINGDIRFENVHFRYPLREGHAIFSNVNFHIKAGQITAIVGPSGCGKSTVCSLLLRFYDPVKGVISLGGQNIKNFSPVWLRNQIGFVSQTPVLFSGSIKENILYGSRSTYPPNEEVLRNVANQANALTFICELQNGFETPVGERGVTLSGGQQQRIAIARALIKDPKILLLDEATSALDVESEDLVRDALEKASIGRTTITIAHRLSTVRRADNIIVLDETGSVAESGDYKDLMLINNGIFRRMVENQMLLFQ